jgi:hypothetical protein
MLILGLYMMKLIDQIVQNKLIAQLLVFRRDMMKLIDQIIQNKLVHSARLFYLCTLDKTCVYACLYSLSL